MLSRTALPLLRQRSLASPARLAFSNSQFRSFATKKEPLRRVVPLSNENIKPRPTERPTPTYNPVAPLESAPKTVPQESTDTQNDTNSQPPKFKSTPKPAAKETPAPIEDAEDVEPQQPRQPLPDLTKGIPSTLEAELRQFQKNPEKAEDKFNITEDPENPAPSGGGRGGGELPRSAYVSSSDRRRSAAVKYVYLGITVGAIGYALYLGRDWESEEEKQAHSDVPNGYTPGLIYDRARARLGTTVSYYSDPVTTKLLPDEDPDPNLRMPFVLVLSLEDMLVHSEWSRQAGWRVAKRPGVDYFLRYLSQYYELVLFTSQPSFSVDQILRKLDPYSIIRWPLFREHTTYKDGGYVKDLAYLNRDLKKVVVIDTDPHHVRNQPENAIVIPKWTGDPKDQTLIQLIPFLEYLAMMGFDDTRTVLKSFEGKNIPIEFQKRIDLLREKFEKEQAAKRGGRSRGGGFGSLLGGKKPAGGDTGSENKMIWDQIREQGQKNYEAFEKNIRENGAKWLAEQEAEQKKFQEQSMNEMKSTYFSWLGPRKSTDDGEKNAGHARAMSNQQYGLARKPVGPAEEPISPQSFDSTPRRDSSLSPAPLDLDATISYFNPRRSSAPSKFSDFPSKIIQKILWTVDSNSFASLCLINRQWHREAQVVELYAHHLSRCPSYALTNTVITAPFKRNDLYRLKTRFAAEVRRNLFDAYLRPRRTIINLVSINANSSAALPGGEVFRFTFSPNGKTVLALSSSRIYVLDATGASIVVKRELKTLRRPLSASITDDGTLLAVLSSEFQANVYGLPPNSNVKHLQVIPLTHSPRTIAIAHEGTVLAAAYETGVEVFSLALNALKTDRRAVRSEAVDTLTFSGDGAMLVGSSLSLDEPNAVVISAPFYSENDPDLSPRETHSRMWTTQILFPQITSVCSHVALLPGHNESDATWLFAYDHSLLSYRAVRTDDTRAGVAYFLNPASMNRFSIPSPTIAPTASACGTLVAAGFGGAGLCIYGIPEKLDITPDMGAVVERHERRIQAIMPLTSATGNMEPLMAYSPSVSGISDSIEDDSLASKVDWRQSVFVKCRQVASLDGHVAAKWVEKPEGNGSGFQGKRLLVVAPGGVGSASFELGEEDMPVDGSRICLLDFDYMPGSGGDSEVVIEVGDNEPELLVEYTGSIATEVALERRRTIRAAPGPESVGPSLGRSYTAVSPPMSFMPDGIHRGSVSQPSSPIDGPSSPRLDLSATGLQRSSTTAGFRHALYPPRPPIGSQPFGESASRGGNGRRSSNGSWETPPPPYTNDQSASPSGLMANLHGPFAQIPNFSPPSSSTSPRPSIQGLRSFSQPSQNFQPLQTQPTYMPYRAFNPRTSTTLDGMPTTDTAPTRRTMSQYGALSRFRRGEQGSPSLGTVAESPTHRYAVRSVSLSPSVSDDASQQISETFFSRPRPVTHHGASRDPMQDFERADTLPISPISLEPRSPLSDDLISPEAPRQLSLTGANLQNRLNHPVPPVPDETPAVLPISNFQPQVTNLHAPPAHTLYAPMMPEPNIERNDFPMMPTPDQLARLNNRARQSITRRPVPSNIDTAPVAEHVGVPPSPPRGAWGAAGVPGSPSFHQARNVPNGLSPSHSRNNSHNINNLASVSTPNLLTRPPYGRLDTIESIGETHAPHQSGLGRPLSRTQSVIYMTGRETSAYNETKRAAPGVPIAPAATAVTISPTSKGKGKKKKKDDGSQTDRSGKKTSRCLVM